MIKRLNKISSRYNKAYFSVALLVLLILADGIAIHNAGAQGSQWTPPQVMPGFDLDSWPPILIADQSGTVHAFSSQWVRDESLDRFRAIVYNQWTLARGWTYPIDIILSPSKEARLTDVYLDKEDMFHLVFFGGDNTGANIYYTKAPAANAEAAWAWSYPRIIGANAGDPEGAMFVEDDQGNLFVVYNGRELGNGLYVVSSGDGGESWSNPTPIFFALSDEPNIAQLEVIKGVSGSFHAIWGVFNVAGQGRGIYYTRSENGIDWSEPVLLADALDGLGTQKPTIVEYNNILIALYIMPPKITMRRSMDDGQTWGDPSIIFPRHVGMNGELSLAIDGNGDIHLFFGQRISGSPDIHGMWHSTYVNNRWIEPEAIIKGPRVTDTEGGNGFDPNFARAVVSQGNTILLTWKTDPAAGHNGVWYSFIKINAPELPIVPLLSPEVSINENPYVVADIPLEHTPIPASPISPPQEINGVPPIQTDRVNIPMSSSTPILIGSFLAAIIIFVAVANKLNRR